MLQLHSLHLTQHKACGGVQGRQWGVHVLEAPWSWLLAAVYIAATVIVGHPPVRTIFAVSLLHSAFAISRANLSPCHELCCQYANEAAQVCLTCTDATTHDGYGRLQIQIATAAC